VTIAVLIVVAFRWCEAGHPGSATIVAGFGIIRIASLHSRHRAAAVIWGVGAFVGVFVACVDGAERTIVARKSAALWIAEPLAVAGLVSPTKELALAGGAFWLALADLATPVRFHVPVRLRFPIRFRVPVGLYVSIQLGIGIGIGITVGVRVSICGSIVVVARHCEHDDAYQCKQDDYQTVLIHQLPSVVRPVRSLG